MVPTKQEGQDDAQLLLQPLFNSKRNMMSSSTLVNTGNTAVQVGQITTPSPSYLASIPLSIPVRSRSTTKIVRTQEDAALPSMKTGSRSPVENVVQLQPPSLINGPMLPTSASKRTHIPRPPNAFMLYRSDFLKKKLIPPSIEHRQQNLSVIIAQCWNRMTPEERREWHDKAAVEAANHQRMYPGYKFAPSRTPSRAKSARKANRSLSEENRIRQNREKYTDIAKSMSCSQGITRIKPEDEYTSVDNCGILSSFPTAFVPASPCLPRPDPSGINPALPPCFPSYTMTHNVIPRRPSASLGFATKWDDDFFDYDFVTHFPPKVKITSPLRPPDISVPPTPPIPSHAWSTEQDVSLTRNEDVILGVPNRVLPSSVINSPVSTAVPLPCVLLNNRLGIDVQGNSYVHSLPSSLPPDGLRTVVGQRVEEDPTSMLQPPLDKAIQDHYSGIFYDQSDWSGFCTFSSYY